MQKKKGPVLIPRLLLFIIIPTVLLLLLSCSAGVDVGGITIYALTITTGGNGTTFPAGTIEVNHGVQTYIQATPADSYSFVNWNVVNGSGVTFGNAYEASTTVTLAGGSATIQANFSQDVYQLTITNDGHGTTFPSGNIMVIKEVPTDISAEPSEGYGFVNWSVEIGSGVSFDDETAAVTTVTLTGGDATIQANFSDVPTGTVTVNSDDEYTGSTNVTLTISASDPDGVDEMMVSNDSGFTEAIWEAYDTSKDWVIDSGDGTHTVYIKFKDYTGTESDAYNDSIILDETVPAVIITNLHDYGVVESGFVIGTATDNYEISSIGVKLDDGSYADATGTTDWVFQLPTGGSIWKDGSEHTVLSLIHI